MKYFTSLFSILLLCFVCFSFSPPNILCWKDLMDDFSKNPQFAEFIQNAGDNDGLAKAVKAYYYLNGVERRLDIDALNKTKELLEDTPFLEKIGGGDAEIGSEALQEIIQKNIAAPCCGIVGGATHLKFIHNYLDDVKHFANTFGPPNATPGYDGVIGTLQSGNMWVVESAAQMFKKFSAEPTVFTKAKVESIDQTFLSIADEASDLSCPNCKFDVAMKDGTKYEFKSYISSTVEGIPNSAQFRKQHVAYLEDVGNQVDWVNYIFENEKLVSFPSAYSSRSEFVRTMFLDMYDKFTVSDFTKTKDFWQEINPSLSNHAQFKNWLVSQSNTSDWLVGSIKLETNI